MDNFEKFSLKYRSIFDILPTEVNFSKNSNYSKKK